MGLAFDILDIVMAGKYAVVMAVFFDVAVNCREIF